MKTNLRRIADNMIGEALKAVDPFRLILDQVGLNGNELRIRDIRYDLQAYKNIYLIGAGKGAAPMAGAVEQILGDRLKAGVICVKYGHGQALRKTKVFEAGHPIPDSNTLNATRHILEMVETVDEHDLVIVLITGGGSALLEALPDDISLTDLAQVNELLLSSGAGIEEINTIRKHISLVKGGQLARQIAPATTVTLILSDVIGDPLQSIASGPTAGDLTTFADALAIIDKYQLKDRLPTCVWQHLRKGQSGQIEETPKPDSALFERVCNTIIGNNYLALQRLAQTVKQEGFNPLILSDRVQGEAREIARLMAAVFRCSQSRSVPISSPGCLILGGEPTVTLRGKGKGGRNQELVLAVLQDMPDDCGAFYFCSVGSDGTDGPTDAAGAWIDQDTPKKAARANLNPRKALVENNAYPFFRALDQLIVTGPTRTNVMDIMFFLF